MSILPREHKVSNVSILFDGATRLILIRLGQKADVLTAYPNLPAADALERMDQEQDIALVVLDDSRAKKISDSKPKEETFELVEWDEILEDEWCKVEESK